VERRTWKLGRLPHVSPLLGNVGELDKTHICQTRADVGHRRRIRIVPSKLNGPAPRLGLEPSLGVTVLCSG
jgi:hypothetical protein